MCVWIKIKRKFGSERANKSCKCSEENNTNQGTPTEEEKLV